MSWLSRSLTGLLREEEAKEDAGGEFWDDPELFDSGKSVKDEFSEFRKNLTQSLWGVAEFLAPPPTSPSPAEKLADDDQHPQEDVSTSENSPKKKLSGIQSDFAELKGGFAKGLSRLSSVIRGGDQNAGSDDQGLTGLLKPLIDNVLSTPEEVQSGNLDAGVEDDGESGGLDSTTRSLPATLASHIDGISRLASTLFPFVNEDDEQPDDVLQAPGITLEVVDFAKDISKHPETWLDFPVISEDGFEMSNAQAEHAYAVESCAQRLAALKAELCPQHMSEERFWKIYFVLLHSRLSEDDAALLSTPQVLEARTHLLKELRKERKTGDEQQIPGIDDGASAVGASADADSSPVVDKDAIPSTVKLASAASKVIDEAEADEWLEEEDGSGPSRAAGGIIGGKFQGGSNDEDDVSFSDLEDEDDKPPQQGNAGEHEMRAHQQSGWVELNQGGEAPVKKHERAGSNDWLTVDKEDVTSGN